MIFVFRGKSRWTHATTRLYTNDTIRLRALWKKENIKKKKTKPSSFSSHFPDIVKEEEEEEKFDGGLQELNYERLRYGHQTAVKNIFLRGHPFAYMRSDFIKLCSENNCSLFSDQNAHNEYSINILYLVTDFFSFYTRIRDKKGCRTICSLHFSRQLGIDCDEITSTESSLLRSRGCIISEKKRCAEETVTDVRANRAFRKAGRSDRNSPAGPVGKTALTIALRSPTI